MANPKPVYTLTRWKVLGNEEASELIDTGRMQREIPNVPTEYFTNAELETLSKGQTLFCVWKGQYIMVAYRDGRFVGYEVEERKHEPPKSVAEKVRAFFRGMFAVMLALVMLTSCENLVTRNFGGSQTIELEKGQRLVEITFKGNDLWILTEPMDSDYVPKTKTFYEDSNLGVMQGKITIVEQR
jgi:hypothetical protein